MCADTTVKECVHTQGETVTLTERNNYIYIMVKHSYQTPVAYESPDLQLLLVTMEPSLCTGSLAGADASYEQVEDLETFEW